MEPTAEPSKTEEGQSRLTGGLDGLDPEYVRLIELSLMAMTDYARTHLAGCSHPVISKIMAKDIDRADAMLELISQWFEAANA